MLKIGVVVKMMTHEKPDGLLETCTAASPEECPVKTPHHDLQDVESAVEWNEIKKTVRLAKAAYKDVDFDTSVANKMLERLEEGLPQGDDVEIADLIADLERQIAEYDHIPFDHTDLMSAVDQWRFRYSPFRLHNGAASWRFQSEIEADSEPGVLVLEDNGRMDPLILSGLGKPVPGRDDLDVYYLDSMTYLHRPITMKIVASTRLEKPLEEYFDTRDLLWQYAVNPLGRPFRIRRNGVVEPAVYPAACVFLYPVNCRGTHPLLRVDPVVLVVDASDHPGHPLPPEFQRVVDPKGSRRAGYSWDAFQYGVKNDLSYADAVDRYLTYLQDDGRI